MLTRNQIHHRHVVSGCDVSHPIGMRGVGAIKVIEVTVFENLDKNDYEIKRKKQLVPVGDLLELIRRQNGKNSFKVEYEVQLFTIML